MFSSSTAAALPGSDWLRSRRAAAAKAVEHAPLPSTEEEIWRYSRIAELDPEQWDLATDAGKTGEAIPATIPDRAATVRLSNGRLVDVEIGDPGVRVEPVADERDGLGSVMEEPTDVFAAMSDAFAAEPIVVEIAGDAELDAPIVIESWVDADGGAVFPRIVLVAGPNSEARVVELQGSADVVSLSIPIVEIVVGQAARLRYVTAQNLASTVWQLATQIADVRRDAFFESSTAAIGGDYTRLRADTAMTGPGAQGNMLAIYFGQGQQALDFRTFQDHVAPHTRSDLLFKGALDGAARSIYSGLIRVRKEASAVEAFQTNRNIKLSKEAWAESVAEPRDREQRRQMQPCVCGRSDRQGSTVLSREPRRADAGR